MQAKVWGVSELGTRIYSEIKCDQLKVRKDGCVQNAIWSHPSPVDVRAGPQIDPWRLIRGEWRLHPGSKCEGGHRPGIFIIKGCMIFLFLVRKSTIVSLVLSTFKIKSLLHGGAAVRTLRKRHTIKLAGTGRAHNQASEHKTGTPIWKFCQIGSESVAFQWCIVYMRWPLRFSTSWFENGQLSFKSWKLINRGSNPFSTAEDTKRTLDCPMPRTPHIHNAVC